MTTDQFIEKHGYNVFDNEGRIKLSEIYILYQLVRYGFDKQKANNMLNDLNIMSGHTSFKLIHKIKPWK